MRTENEKTCRTEIEKVISLEHRGIGKSVLHKFIKYMEDTNMQTLEDMRRGNHRNLKTHNTTQRLEGAKWIRNQL